MHSGDLVTGMGDQEICALTGRLLDNPGELAYTLIMSDKQNMGS